MELRVSQVPAAGGVRVLDAAPLHHLLMLTVLFLNRSQHKLSDIVAFLRFASRMPVYKRA